MLEVVYAKSTISKRPAHRAPSNEGTAPTRVSPMPEKPPHGTLNAPPDSCRHLESRHEVRGDGKEDSLHQDQASSARGQPLSDKDALIFPNFP